jgi:hypothetical protein
MTSSKTRIHSGHAAQLRLADSLVTAFPTAEIVSVAPPGSQLPDVVIRLNGALVQFEVKFAKSLAKPLVVINKQAKRGLPNELDSLISDMVGVQTTLTELIDQARLTSDSVGFPSDDGVRISGKLPSSITTARTGLAATTAARDIIVEHLHAKGDHYVAIVDASTDTIVIFHTGLGDNPLGAPTLPLIKSVSLKTYGTPSTMNGPMRIGINTVLELSESGDKLVIPA